MQAHERVSVSMLPATGRDVDRFTPTYYDDAPGAPVYLIGVPSRIERARWRREIAREGGEFVTQDRQLAALRDAIEQTCDESSRVQAFMVLERLEALTEEFGAIVKPLPETATDEERAAHAERIAAHATVIEEHSELLRDVEAIERKMRAAWPPYADLMAANAYWWELAPMLAVYQWLRGWEGGSDLLPPCQTNGAGAPSRELIDQLPEKDLTAIGWQAIGLMSLKGQAKKA